jgi:hypothetical protein
VVGWSVLHVKGNPANVDGHQVLSFALSLVQLDTVRVEAEEEVRRRKAVEDEEAQRQSDRAFLARRWLIFHDCSMLFVAIGAVVGICILSTVTGDRHH